MAIFYNGISGPFSGKVGDVVGSKWRDINYIRAKPKRTKKPKQLGQITTNNSFTLIHQTLMNIESLVNECFASYPGKGTGRNSAHSYNGTRAIIQTGNGPAIDFSRFLFSWGDLDGTRETKAWANGPLTLFVSWDTSTTTKKASPDDEVICLTYSRKLCAFLIIRKTVRKDGQLQYELPRGLAGQEIEVMIAFKSHKNGSFSQSQYVGRVDLEQKKVSEAATEKVTDEQPIFCKPINLPSGSLFSCQR
ncbi:DUF6266 family protein [Desertivirga xinjiangensis]|uniref:DUF6266 family protein n=1 Tax=Desertivirga xinjiangensis TaxID=539206 RepID=UPI00210D17A5|nr:DUF6266 family protein [Pedobacter xinjiangensis]